jgi:single-strand DNA-binding protein
MKKGRQIYIEGRLQTSSWDDKTSGQKRYKTEIIAENMIMLGGKPGEGGASSPAMPVQERAEQPSPTDSLPEIQIDNSDIPF